MSIARLRFMAAALAIVGSGVAITVLHARQSPPAWVVGDVFVAVGKGQYEVYDKNGGFKQTIDINIQGLQDKDTAGCWFDSVFNLYTADFYNTKVIKHNLAVPHAQSVFADTL